MPRELRDQATDDRLRDLQQLGGPLDTLLLDDDAIDVQAVKVDRQRSVPGCDLS
jgi:hypothetical protein